MDTGVLDEEYRGDYQNSMVEALGLEFWGCALQQRCHFLNLLEGVYEA